MDRKNNRTPIVGKIFLPKVWGLDWNNIFVSFAFICLYNDWLSLSLTWDKWPRLCVSECATRGRKSGPKASSSFQSCVLYRDGQKKREKTLGPYTDVNRKPQVSIKQENGNASNRGNSRLRIDIYNTDLSLICTHMGAKKNLISLSLCVIHKSKYIESFLRMSFSRKLRPREAKRYIISPAEPDISGLSGFFPIRFMRLAIDAHLTPPRSLFPPSAYKE